MKARHLIALISVIIFSGCATYAGINFDQLFGKESVREREVPYGTALAEHYIQDVKPVIDGRCVVCHACYDAPCQLKMSSTQGIDRGGSKNKIYNGTRLTATTPTRLFEDAETTQEWRDFNFHPVLNERNQTSQANVEASLIAKMLLQKEEFPLPQQEQLEGFDFSIYRTEQCTTVEEHASYQKDYPNWGMPFGMPNLSSSEFKTLMNWLETGALMSANKPITHQEQQQIAKWETFFNQSDLKTQLSSRYLYEHLYLFHLYFSDINNEPRFFNLVRSSTPPGKPVERISTRRPYDDPSVERVYYRLIPELGTTVDKTHMPYALNSSRYDNWVKWFVESEYTVSNLPSYEVEVSANPMTAFVQLPVKSRFNFLVDNAQNTIMAFIKGPVCRGQLALNVINDRFWVFFVDPVKANVPEINAFYTSQKQNLKLPGEKETIIAPVTNWISYSKQQARYLKAKSDFTNEWFVNGEHLTTGVIWNGAEVNPNAALTVFRHFDSASVVQGLVGQKPKTAWIIDYALLERIHYLLVAGFDVYGNFGHQLVTRLYMDFLRLEGESNFLSLLPKDVRHTELNSWYQDQSEHMSNFLTRNIKPFDQPSGVIYKTDNYKSELFDRIKVELNPVLNDRFNIVNTGFKPETEAILNKFDHIVGFSEDSLPQISMIMIEAEDGNKQLFTLLRNNAHKNISSLFNEEKNRTPEQDDLTLVRGVIGSYPAAFWRLKEDEVPKLYQMLSSMQNEEDYVKLLDRFAIRRSSPEFWPFSDLVHQWYKQEQPVEFGLLDYNRFENR
ncbi:fatty acid cis/trans isomerase [Vibrio algarum]|uniref:Fatty acid cis/trans isomerase n=1 Tax=Vibrio algarum TaxID=3020714 RepID=A0ABT4YXJ1_9VIBR|nr:fatty acid cis/trans isomerase [Vibrio sp. KJ40-1]MDB1126075.1 fatty acid cis/trans isomerase [Vibrio sp. KJ40-1]